MTDACRKHIHCVCATRDDLLVCSVLCLFSYSYIKDHLKNISKQSMLYSCVRWGLCRRRSISYCRAGVVWRYQDLVWCGGVLNVSCFECIFSLVSFLYHLHPSACHHFSFFKPEQTFQKRFSLPKFLFFFSRNIHRSGLVFAHVNVFSPTYNCVCNSGDDGLGQKLWIRPNPHKSVGSGFSAIHLNPQHKVWLSPQYGKVEASKISVTFCWLKFLQIRLFVKVC